MFIKRFITNSNTGKISLWRLGLLSAGLTAPIALVSNPVSTYLEEQSKVELSNDYFVKYRISWRHFVDKDHYLLEIEPIKRQQNNLWKEHGYRKLWSIQVKQPQIHVVRHYTPLPLEHVDSENNGIKLKVLEDGDSSGKMMLYIKKYENGEVARWMSTLPIGNEIEIRGPYIDYQFPEAPADEICLDRRFLNDGNDQVPVEALKYKPYDVNFFTGGTGIVTPLQLMLTENPFKGKIQIIHACKNYQEELSPLIPFIDLLKSKNRLQMHYFEDFKSELKNKRKLNKLIKAPFPFESLDIPSIGASSSTTIKPVVSFVVGPEGFIANVCGPKYDLNQGPITGYLDSRGWDNDTVYKLS
ncbi:related to Cytochrome c mitochondrial import factor CYC2 [Hanseniaspora guilliermondii]|uniref:Related to Cytochrome c mitochondrial import factor CYC2 n=1 Tax=Hanseniaspora guilliermondii TaxID=56406 RepID=A0A1L0AWU2_9ASCO|nr:related to Cytochrome c mitochondrial import factor CYC2 [Hanseniaspora guilliermondii]